MVCLYEPEIGPEADQLRWWANRELLFLRVAVVARRLFSIPATPVPSERVFSKTGAIVTAKRSALKLAMVDVYSPPQCGCSFVLV